MTELSAVCFDLDGTLCVQDQDGDALLATGFERAGVGPGSVLMVGDDLGADVGGAREVGMRSAWVPVDDPPDDPDPTPSHVSDSRTDVAAL